MKVKLTSSGAMAGTRFSFVPRQVIECSETTGKSLIANGAAVEVPKDTPTEGILHDDPPEEERAFPPPGRQKFPASAKTPEQATMGTGQKAVTTGAKSGRCQAETKAGNPCLRAPIEGSDFCPAHQPKEGDGE